MIRKIVLLSIILSLSQLTAFSENIGNKVNEKEYRLNA